LYNYYAVKETRNICPQGWHPATQEDYQEMWKYLQREYGLVFHDVGGALKSSDYAYWQPENIGATNVSGFSAIPAGGIPEGKQHYHAIFWMHSDRPVEEYSQFFNLYGGDDAIRYDFSGAPHFGYSVRCVKDRE
ncbi:MAG: fibrobacter succinogenes major paralogous domain-containing protein, partial [Bacteroidales bacterium]|nr:fibrobacter succinogenes major paralogous domain-containing protein [Bacteroidales bacterium]